jgi:allophanate hydrolase
MKSDNVGSLQIARLKAAYESRELDPRAVIEAVFARIEAFGASPAFIALRTLDQALADLAEAEKRRAAGEELPLYGIPFAVKDNFDVAGMPTTAACPAFAYTPAETAPPIRKLIDKGAILIGKTNLDQFATGLVGTRTPYGICRSAIDPRYVSGGSSSGSAVVVAHDLVSFALGTDTAGSGRVPAGFNNIVGIKPTRGLVSTRGLVPACRALDCASVFAGTVADAWQVLEIMAGYDPEHALSRKAKSHALERSAEAGASFRFGVPSSLEFFGNAEYARLFDAARRELEALGGKPVTIDVEPLVAAGALLYGGPWVAERFAAVGEFIEQHTEETHPVVRDIILAGKRPSAYELFRAEYQLAEYRRYADGVFEQCDIVLFPTTGTIYTVDEVLAEPVKLNSNLGRYTNFVNLLDLSALAVPAGFTAEGLPFGITLMGPAFADARLADIAQAFQQKLGLTIGATSEKAFPQSPPVTSGTRADRVLLAVAGAHLSGMPLNHELTSRGATLVRVTRTSPEYQLFALAGTVPPKPGLVHRPGFSGPGIEVEVWELDREAFGSFVANVPTPMTIGTVTLEDGSKVKGFSCEPHALEGSPEITHFGGFRAYLKARNT